MSRSSSVRPPSAGPEQAVRVAVVDDSTFIRKAILRMLDDEPMIEVVGSAGSSTSAARSPS